jgi:excisionase family DNA binding protein
MPNNTILRGSNERDVYSVAEAGARLGISRDHAYRLAAKGELPTLRLGRRLVVPRVQLERLLRGGAR